MAKSAQPTRWQRFRRIPSLKRLVLFSLFMMVGGLAALVAGVFAIHLFAPRMIGDASIAGKGKMFGGIWNSRPGKTVFGERKRVNLLIVGVDYNHDSKGIIYTKGARTDTMMVASLGEDAQFLNVVSIPRDTYVEVNSSGGYDKINAAYSYGGIHQTRETVSRFLGVPVNYHVIVKVHGAKKVIDALGGIVVDVEKDMDYDDNWGGLHIHLKKGPQKLTGEQLIGYARFRNDEEGDRGRMRRQQQVIRACIKRLKDPALVTRFPALSKAVKETLDTDLSIDQMIDLAMLYSGFDATKMRSAQIVGDDQLVNEAFVIVPYAAENNKTVRRLLKDEIDLSLKDMRIRVLNGTHESNLANLVADELNLDGFNVVSVSDNPERNIKATQIIEHVQAPRVHTRLQGLFPNASFTDSASKNPNYDITIIVGSDRGQLSERPRSEPAAASHWEQPSGYPTYREPEAPAAPRVREPEPEPEPEQAPAQPDYPRHQPEPEPQPEPEQAPPAPEPAPIHAPAPEPPAPAPVPINPPPAPAPAPAEPPAATPIIE